MDSVTGNVCIAKPSPRGNRSISSESAFSCGRNGSRMKVACWGGAVKVQLAQTALISSTFADCRRSAARLTVEPPPRSPSFVVSDVACYFLTQISTLWESARFVYQKPSCVPFRIGVDRHTPDGAWGPRRYIVGPLGCTRYFVAASDHHAQRDGFPHSDRLSYRDRNCDFHRHRDCYRQRDNRNCGHGDRNPDRHFDRNSYRDRDTLVIVLGVCSSGTDEDEYRDCIRR